VTAVAEGGEELETALAELLDHAPDARRDRAAFWGRQFDLGLAWVHFPRGQGGLGADPRAQLVVDAALGAARVPGNWFVNPMGIGMVAPTLVAHGTHLQQERFLRPLFTGEEIWCQLFSEPDAGSDVASASTRARRDGDEWVVDGQKVWTSLGHAARFGLLLARTDPDVPKHRGLTLFLVDMSAPGVEVRPLRQMTGDAEFSEVHLAGARVPDAMRVGAEGDGWRVALTTLMNERVAIGGQTPARGSGLVAEAVRLWAAAPRPDPVRRDQVARVWIEAEVLRLTNVRAKALRARGVPGPAGSIAKLLSTELHQRILAVCMALLGADGLRYESGYAPRHEEGLASLVETQRTFLRSAAYTIEGGTSEIMRNIVAERVLGLPGEVRVDRDVPWSELPRGAARSAGGGTP
jgi:alkylation response protein AidB-like acyl-CoA dehydrogenase